MISRQVQFVEKLIPETGSVVKV